MTEAATRVFVSYRREDSRHVAGRLADHLRTRFQLFMDVETVQPGSDFTQAVGRAVGESDVLLAVIGQQWSAVRDEHGRRRLDDMGDWVVFEISAALQRGITVIPVLVDGARMPAAVELPPALQPLASRQAVYLRHESFADDATRLEGVIQQVAARSPIQQPAPARRPGSRKGLIAALVALLVVLGAGTAVAINVIQNGSGRGASTGSASARATSQSTTESNSSESGSDSSSPEEPSESASPDDPGTPQNGLSLGTSAPFEFYVATVTTAAQDPSQGFLIKAEVCGVKATPSSTDGKSQISWSPWQVMTTSGHTYPAKLRDESTEPDSMFPKTGRYPIGECATGLIPFGDVPDDDPVVKISYINQFGNVASWNP
jgi:hypothetical protein